MLKFIKVVVIYGSVCNGRFCDVVVGWVVDWVEVCVDYMLDVIDFFVEGFIDLCGIDGVMEKVIVVCFSWVDVFIVVMFEYNYSFLVVLKYFIDGFNEFWYVKLVVFVFYGGFFGGSCVVE